MNSFIDDTMFVVLGVVLGLLLLITAGFLFFGVEDPAYPTPKDLARIDNQAALSQSPVETPLGVTR